MAKISALTEAVREALIALRDPDASASDVRAKIVELHPNLKEGLTAASFGSRLYNQREWAREEIDGQRARTTTRAKKPTGPSTLERYQIAERFLALCGGQPSHAEEVLGFLEKVDAAELRQAYEGWQQLVSSAGNAQKARQILATMRDTGMI